MTAQTLAFYFDFGSPTTCRAHTPLPRIAAETGARLVYRPMLPGRVLREALETHP